MKIISWNVAGIKARVNDIERLIQEYQPDIVCLQKIRTDKAPDFDGYRVHVDCADQWSGVATYVHSCLDEKFIESDSHHLILEFDGFVIVNAYVPYSNPKVQGYVERRREWNKWIVEFANKQTKPVIVCGDLNIVHTDLDSYYSSCVRNTGCYYQWERDDFNRLLSEGKLVDSFRKLHPEEKAYTYFDTMHGVDYRATNQGSRLDYFLVSKSLMPYVMKSEILSPLSAPSNPILLDLQLNKIKKRMKALTYIGKGQFEVTEKEMPAIQVPTDAVVRVTLSSICTSDLHIKHGGVPRAVPGITVGHEMVGVVESVGESVSKVRPGDRVAVNVETFCGECFFCRHGWVNNCTDPNGGWALGCRIDGGQTEFVRVPFADNGLTKIPDNVSDEQALFVGDILATGYWAAKISEISQEDTVLIIGTGPTGLCTLQCVRLYNPKRIIVCELDTVRREFVKAHYPEVVIAAPDECLTRVAELSEHGGADRVIEVAGAEDTFQLAWQAARPNAIVTVVALYDKPQVLPLPDMYGKNLTFKTGGVDGCDCEEILRLISEGKIDTTPLITHTFPFSQIEEAYDLFENRHDNVIKVAITPN